MVGTGIEMATQKLQTTDRGDEDITLALIATLPHHQAYKEAQKELRNRRCVRVLVALGKFGGLTIVLYLLFALGGRLGLKLPAGLVSTSKSITSK